jgi:hypothetical protein
MLVAMVGEAESSLLSMVLYTHNCGSATIGLTGPKMQNNQQRVFAGGHPPNWLELS